MIANLLAGAGTVNTGVEVTVPLPVLGVNVIEAVVKAVEPKFVAVKPLKVATPLELVVAVVVPPKDQLEPCPEVTAAFTTIPEPKALLYWSLTVTIGWVASTAPLNAGAVGWVDTTKLAGTPTLIVCDTVASAYPVLLITIALLAPAVCNRPVGLEDEGVKVIFPLLIA